jgi:hypothetical protein
MLREGEYIAWFRTALGSGTGRVRLKDGKISGSDSIISYSGTYVVAGDAFTVTIKTRRHARGHDSLVGGDEVELTLNGISRGDFACCSGLVAGSSDTKIDVTLIRVKPEGVKAPIVYTPEDFHPERLPAVKTR